MTNKHIELHEYERTQNLSQHTCEILMENSLTINIFKKKNQKELENSTLYQQMQKNEN